MKKIFINELETEERNKLIKNNKKLIEILQNNLYEYNMFMQEEEGREMFGADYYKYIDTRNHYSSFYLVLEDWRGFMDNLDSDYLRMDEALAMYNSIKKDIEELDALDVNDEEYDKKYDLIEFACKNLLSLCETQLHEYENNYPTEDDAIEYADEMEQLEDYYIEEREDGTTDGVIRKDIAFTECYI